jgi:hypothetical protein
MAVSEEQAKARWATFDAAARKVKGQLIAKSGGAGAENDYADAYQALVRDGLAQQLRGKYR